MAKDSTDLGISIAPAPIREKDKKVGGIHYRLIAAVLAPMLLYACLNYHTVWRGVVYAARIVVGVDNRTGGQGGDPFSIILDEGEERARRATEGLREQSEAVKRAAIDAKTSAIEAKLKAMEAKQELDRKYDSLREETRRDVERAKALAEETKAAAHKAEMALSAAKMASDLAGGVGNALSSAADKLSRLGPGDLPTPRAPAVQQASIRRQPSIPKWRRDQAELDEFMARMGAQTEYQIQQYNQGVQNRHNAAMRGMMP